VIDSWDWNKVRIREFRQDGQPRKRVEPFALLPLGWAAQAAAATNTRRALVWVWLVQQARTTGSNTIAMSNEALAGYGVSRKMKTLALRQLQAAGLVAVERPPGKAPIVTLLV
jgi:hypothetical protein